MAYIIKRPADLKAGDIVVAHGGRFQIVSDAIESNSHRPLADHLVDAAGPSDCAWATSICLEGEQGGYFWPGSEWHFQGNQNVRLYVEADHNLVQ